MIEVSDSIYKFENHFLFASPSVGCFYHDNDKLSDYYTSKKTEIVPFYSLLYRIHNRDIFNSKMSRNSKYASNVTNSDSLNCSNGGFIYKKLHLNNDRVYKRDINNMNESEINFVVDILKSRRIGKLNQVGPYIIGFGYIYDMDKDVIILCLASNKKKISFFNDLSENAILYVNNLDKLNFMLQTIIGKYIEFISLCMQIRVVNVRHISDSIESLLFPEEAKFHDDLKGDRLVYNIDTVQKSIDYHNINNKYLMKVFLSPYFKDKFEEKREEELKKRFIYKIELIDDTVDGQEEKTYW